MHKRPPSLPVSSVMRRDVVTIPLTASFWDVARIFAERHITGAPVVDDAGDVVGVISQSDLIRYLREVALSEREAEDFYSAMEPDRPDPMRISITAGQLMSSNVLSIEEDAPIHEARMLMHRERVHRLIVLKERRAVGILTTMNLL